MTSGGVLPARGTFPGRFFYAKKHLMRFKPCSKVCLQKAIYSCLKYVSGVPGDHPLKAGHADHKLLRARLGGVEDLLREM